METFLSQHLANNRLTDTLACMAITKTLRLPSVCNVYIDIVFCQFFAHNGQTFYHNCAHSSSATACQNHTRNYKCGFYYSSSIAQSQ